MGNGGGGGAQYKGVSAVKWYTDARKRHQLNQLVLTGHGSAGVLFTVWSKASGSRRISQINPTKHPGKAFPRLISFQAIPRIPTELHSYCPSRTSPQAKIRETRMCPGRYELLRHFSTHPHPADQSTSTRSQQAFTTTSVVTGFRRVCYGTVRLLSKGSRLQEGQDVKYRKRKLCLDCSISVVNRSFFL